MLLKEYIDKYKIDRYRLALSIEISPRTMDAYLCNARRPSRKTAKKIEDETKGEVTIGELRGFCEECRKKLRYQNEE